MHVQWLFLSCSCLASAIPTQTSKSSGACGAKKSVSSTLPTINSTQALAGDTYIGKAADAKSLSPNIQYKPRATLMHQDGGNTGSSNYPGPLGQNITLSNIQSPLRTFVWDQHGQMTAGFVQTQPGSKTVSYGLAAMNEETLEIEASWFPSVPGEALNFAYMEMLLDNSSIVVASKQGTLYVVGRTCTNNQPGFELSRTVNLTAEGILKKGELLLNSMTDTHGNIWFTTGGLLAQGGPGDPEQNSTTIGYAEPNGTIHTMHIQDQMIENGIAITGTSVYVVTGPSGADDHANAPGYMYCLKPGSGTGITVVWQQEYSAGSGRKPGAFARGSGSTPTLLGDQYVAITDNHDNQINLIIYHQKAAKASESQVVCSTGVFKSGLSNNDVGALAHLDDKTYGIVLMNNYNAPPLYAGSGSINGPFNNLSIMAAETVRVDVAANGCECKLAWDTPIRIQSVPVLSTKSGLVYGYTQDEKLADQGEYEWYVAALDWRTGEVVWQLRTGAGGSFDDNYLPGTLGPDGTFYQGVISGVVKVKDRSK